MRKTALLAGVLVLCAGAAMAKPREVRGCVELRDLANGSKCLMIKSRSGEYFALEGWWLPPVSDGTVVAVTGEVSRGGCSHRLIRRKIAVTSWTFTRALCPKKPF
jgi:hypothetical protein